MYSSGAGNLNIALMIAGIFVLLTIPLSIHDILQHLLNYNVPELQKHIIRILWMVPVYSTSSWLSLQYKDQSVYIDAIRDFYESYVIYCFFSLLVGWVGSHQRVVSRLASKPPSRGKQLPPLDCCMKPWTLGEPFLFACRVGTLQYVVLKCACAVATIAMQAGGVYDEGTFRLDAGYGYIAVIAGTSQTWAMYCLVQLYKALEEELAPMKPVPKLLCVKAVVFFSWWQSVAIALAAQAGMIVPSSPDWTADDVAKSIQNFLICIEMFMGALAHHRYFKHTDFVGDRMFGDLHRAALERLGIRGSTHFATVVAMPALETSVARGRQGVATAHVTPQLKERAASGGRKRVPHRDQRTGSHELAHLPALGASEGTESDTDTDDTEHTGLLAASTQRSRGRSSSDKPDAAEEGQRPPRSNRKLLQAFLDSTLPLDVMSDIGNVVATRKRQSVDVSEQIALIQPTWGGASAAEASHDSTQLASLAPVAEGAPGSELPSPSTESMAASSSTAHVSHIASLATDVHLQPPPVDMMMQHDLQQLRAASAGTRSASVSSAHVRASIITTSNTIQQYSDEMPRS